MNALVLIADDDPELRQLVRLILQQDGYEVAEAENGEQTLALATGSPPSLILLDVLMPGVNGFDTYRRLKNDQRTKTVPVIFISALNDALNREEGLRLGADNYLGKPLDLQDLSRRVRSAIQRRGINSLFDSAQPNTYDRSEMRRTDDALDPMRRLLDRKQFWQQ